MMISRNDSAIIGDFLNDSAVTVDSCLSSSGDVSGADRPIVAGFILVCSLIAIHFTYFVINMSIAGLLFTTNNLWIAVPCTLNKCGFVSTDLSMVLLATPNTIAYFGYLLTGMTFTVYRFGVIMSTNFSDKKFIIKVLLAFPWLLTLFMTFGTTTMGCLKRFNRYALRYTYDCSTCEILFGFTFMDVNFYFGQGIPVLMIAAHIYILVSVYRRRKQAVASQQRNTLFDFKLAIQFTVICLSQNMSALLFFFVPKIGGNSVWGNVAINIIAKVRYRNHVPKQRLKSGGKVEYGRFRPQSLHDESSIRSTLLLILLFCSYSTSKFTKEFDPSSMGKGER
ncbi:hypothetical protein COOONC_02345 [Cooperia oncophora]